MHSGPFACLHNTSTRVCLPHTPIFHPTTLLAASSLHFPVERVLHHTHLHLAGADVFACVVVCFFSRVKFWIISNYMSPHHRRIIPAMAEKYGFDYEFVTYKWPHWLHKQTDKQRIIWAYKILFLDVLFPLDVPRMIFVDSDQVVRTDLAELYNMDLKVRTCMVGTGINTNSNSSCHVMLWRLHSVHTWDVNRTHSCCCSSSGGKECIVLCTSIRCQHDHAVLR